MFLAWAKIATTHHGFHAFSLKRASLAWARWCLAQNKSSPPEREFEDNPGLFLHVLPGRVSLAWARVTGLATVLPATTTHSHPTNTPSIPQFNHNTLGINHGTVTRKTQTNRSEYTSPSFPYLEKLAGTLIRKREHHSSTDRPKTGNKRWNKTRTRLPRNPNWDYKSIVGGRLILAKV